MRSLLALALVLTACKSPTPTEEQPLCNQGFADRDSDGYGNPNQLTSDCQEPVVDDSSDCNDQRSDINVEATEICDGVDNNCDGLTDIDDPSIVGGLQWLDLDEDGFGDGEPILACDTPAGYAPFGGDCNDAVAEVNPDAIETCDTVDNDCDGLIDDADDNWDPTGAPIFYEDLDGDGYGSDVEVPACALPPLASVDDGDCDDLEPTTYPFAVELCNNADSDCDGAPDGSTTQVDTCAAFEQTTGGPYTVTLVDGATTVTCSGTITLTIDRSVSPAVQGSFTCSLDDTTTTWAPVQSGTLQGTVTRDGIAQGTILAFDGAERDWDGFVDATGFSGEGDGLQIEGGTGWDLSFQWTSEPAP